MDIRAEAVERAREHGLCTQCLKNKAAPHMYQCQRCIDTNKKKNQRRRDMKMCKCGKPAKEGRASCEACLEKQRAYWKKRYQAKKARKDAFGKKDTGAEKRHYNKRVPIASIQMAGAVADLERFIGNLKIMAATDYIEARDELIRSIIKRGGANGNTA